MPPETADIFAENIEALELQFFALKLIPRLIRVLVVLRTCDTRVSVSMMSKLILRVHHSFYFKFNLVTSQAAPNGTGNINKL